MQSCKTGLGFVAGASFGGLLANFSLGSKDRSWPGKRRWQESRFVSMIRLLTAHRILIATAVVFFVFFAFWEYRSYLQTDNGWAVFRAVLYLLVAVCFGVYFKKLKQWYK